LFFPISCPRENPSFLGLLFANGPARFSSRRPTRSLVFLCVPPSLSPSSQLGNLIPRHHSLLFSLVGRKKSCFLPPFPSAPCPYFQDHRILFVISTLFLKGFNLSGIKSSHTSLSQSLCCNFRVMTGRGFPFLLILFQMGLRLVRRPDDAVVFSVFLFFPKS